MKRNVVLSVLALLVAVVFSLSVCAQTQSSKQPAKPAQITKEKAKEITLKAVPGTVKEVEMETEGGQRVYAVEIATRNGIKEVHVDPATGKVLKIEEETAEQEAKEKAEKSKSAAPAKKAPPKKQ